MEDEITIDFGELALILRKHIKFILQVTGVCLVLAVIYLLFASSVYESRALLRIKPPKAIGMSSFNATTPVMNVQSTKQMMTTYKEIIKSIKLENPNTKINIATDFFKDTDIMHLTVYAETPEKAKEANDLLVSNFLSRLTELSQEEYKDSRVFMEKRTQIAEKNLKDAENKLKNFKKKNAIINPLQEIELTKAQIARIENMVEQNNLNLVEAQERLAAVNKQLSGAASSIATNTTIDLYNTRLAELEAQRIEYLEEYTDQHPDVIKINQEITKLKEKLQEEIANVIALKTASNNIVHQDILASKFKCEAEIQVAKGNLKKLSALDKGNKNKVKKLADLNQQYDELDRKIVLARDIYSMLAKRLEEARIAEASAAHEVQVLAKGTFNQRPVKPRKMLILAIVFCVGALGSGCFVIIRELVNKTINTADDVAQYLNLPVLGSIPDYDTFRSEGQKRGEQKGLIAKLGGLFKND